MTCERVDHCTVSPDGLVGKVAWLIQDAMGVKGDGDHRPWLDDEDALSTARAVIDLIDAERILDGDER